MYVATPTTERFVFTKVVIPIAFSITALVYSLWYMCNIRIIYIVSNKDTTITE